MGKLTSGILGPLSQSIGAVTGASVLGKATLRRKSNGGSNPQTASQTAKRTAFKTASEYCSINYSAILLQEGFTDKPGITLFQQCMRWYMAGGRLRPTGPVWTDISTGGERIWQVENWECTGTGSSFEVLLSNSLMPAGYKFMSNNGTLGLVRDQSSLGYLTTVIETNDDDVWCMRPWDDIYDLYTFMKAAPSDMYLYTYLTDTETESEMEGVWIKFKYGSSYLEHDSSLWLSWSDVLDMSKVIQTEQRWGYDMIAVVQRDGIGSDYRPYANLNLAAGGLTVVDYETVSNKAGVMDDEYDTYITGNDYPVVSGNSMLVKAHYFTSPPTFEKMKSITTCGWGIRLKMSRGILFGMRFVACVPLLNSLESGDSLLSTVIDSSWLKPFMEGAGSTFNTPAPLGAVSVTGRYSTYRPRIRVTLSDYGSTDWPSTYYRVSCYLPAGTLVDSASSVGLSGYSGYADIDPAKFKSGSWNSAKYSSFNKVVIALSGYNPVANLMNCGARLSYTFR